MNKILEAIEAHTRIPFPDFPEDDCFSDWVEDLALLGAHLVGLVTSNASDPKAGRLDKSSLLELSSRLKSFSSLEGEDAEIFKACRIYVDSLLPIVDLYNTGRPKRGRPELK